MARVRVEPAGFDLTVSPGETVLEAAFRAGVTWPTICYGQARCTACALLVRDGHENAGPVGPTERGVLRQITRTRRQWPARDTRLACQLTVTGEVTVEKKGAKPAPGERAESSSQPRRPHGPVDS
jgi:ferredoxin, 2Fe-2S